MATAHSNPRFVSGGQPAIMPTAGSTPEGIPDGVFGRAPIPRVAAKW
jgi:hypothetical protein